MSFKQEYITDKELSELEAFLLDRFDDEEDHPDKDEGIIDLSELDGYFAAIVSSPEMIPPSVWMSALWGDFEPSWQSKKQAEKVMGLLIAIMNSINSDFMDSNSQYHPLFEHREFADIKHVIVDEWCFGYMRGVGLCEQFQALDNLKMTILLAPIRAFGSYEGLESTDKMSEDEVINIKNNILPNVLNIFQFWRNNDDVSFSSRGFDNSTSESSNIGDSNYAANILPAIETFRRENGKVGRNELCPCGSGKKYKKCCLH